MEMLALFEASSVSKLTLILALTFALCYKQPLLLAMLYGRQAQVIEEECKYLRYKMVCLL